MAPWGYGGWGNEDFVAWVGRERWSFLAWEGAWEQEELVGQVPVQELIQSRRAPSVLEQGVRCSAPSVLALGPASAGLAAAAAWLAVVWLVLLGPGWRWRT